MRFVAIGGLLLYGIANGFAGALDMFTERRLAMGVDAALVVTGAILTISGVLTAQRSKHALLIAVAGLAVASALAVFNERVLGLGHPSHHLIRGPYTVLVLWAVFRTLRESAPDTVDADGGV